MSFHHFNFINPQKSSVQVSLCFSKSPKYPYLSPVFRSFGLFLPPKAVSWTLLLRPSWLKSQKYPLILSEFSFYTTLFSSLPKRWARRLQQSDFSIPLVSLCGFSSSQCRFPSQTPLDMRRLQVISFSLCVSQSTCWKSSKNSNRNGGNLAFLRFWCIRVWTYVLGFV